MTPPRPDRVPLILGVVSLSVLSAGLPAFTVADVGDVGRSDAWVLTLLVMIWAGARLSLLVARGRAHLFDMFLWLFTYIFLGLAPTVQIRADQISPTTPGMDPGLDLPAAAVVVAGLVAYELARFVRVRPVASRQISIRTPGISGPRTAMLLLLGSAIAAFYVSRVGFAFAQGSREAAGAARASAFADPSLRAVILTAALIPVLIGLGAVLQLRSSARREFRRPLLLVALVAVVVIFAVVSPISSARYTFGTVAFALAVYAGALSTPTRVRVTMVATWLGLLFVFPLADAFRREDGGGLSRGGFFAEYLANSDYDSFWQIANAYSYWQDGLVEPLRQFLGSAFFWVPRSVWDDKPTDTGILLADYRGYSFDNLSAPLWAEALVNGGIIAVVLTFLFFGFSVRHLDARIVLATRTGGAWLVAAAVFPVYTMILLRGSLLQATGTLAVALVCVMLVHSVSSRPSPRLRQQARPPRHSANTQSS